MINYSLKSLDLRFCLPIGLTLFTFIFYWFISLSDRLKKKFNALESPSDNNFSWVFFTKVVGFLSMGVFSFLVAGIFLGWNENAFFGIQFIAKTSLYSIFWILTLSLIVVPLVWFSAKKPKNWVNYPQIRNKFWTPKIFYINLVGWAMYLFGYELLFRGILLFPLVPIIGFWQAVFINTALYSATHIPKGLDETIGAIPLGIILCYLTYESQTIWIAFIVHVIMAWTNSLTALKYHPEIQYIKWKKK